MLASSVNTSEPSHLSQSLCDVSMAHAETSHTCSPLAHHHHTSYHSQISSCLEQQSSSSDVDIDDYAGKFDCNLCFHVCHDPVVTMCGHLFCWPCLFSCLSLNSASKECPVCKADVQEKIVPLYGCGKVGYSTDSLAEKLHGIHIPCRPSATRWIAPITCANASGRSELNEMHTRPSADSGFSAWLLRFGLASLPQNGDFLSRYTHSAVSLIVHRRRFNNEKEFVLHWVFIFMASVAIAIFLAC